MSTERPDPLRGASRADVLGLRPELAAGHERLLGEIWARADPVLLELCRLRAATLVGAAVARTERSPAALAAGLSEDLVEHLPGWPSDPRFTDAHRCALALTEQWVVDHHGITDDHVADLEAAIGAEGVVVLTTALGVWDAQHRLDAALGVTAP